MFGFCRKVGEHGVRDCKDKTRGSSGLAESPRPHLDPEGSETPPEPHGARAHRTAALFWFLFYEGLFC